MKNILNNRKIVIMGIVVLAIILCIIIGMILGGHHQESVPETSDIETNNDIDVDETNDAEKNNTATNDTAKKNQNGLEVVGTPDATIDSVDGSGTWDETHKADDDSNATSKEDSKKNILVDDKVWGDVN